MGRDLKLDPIPISNSMALEGKTLNLKGVRKE